MTIVFSPRRITGRKVVRSGVIVALRPEEDGAAMADHWRAQGMRVTARDTSTGPVVFGGGGGETASISFSAVSGNSTVHAGEDREENGCLPS
ncbi:hypothetical protein L2091_07780 [Curtobacterium albidum]|uniref:hypothetical protein n=1 Tax=Curtobacterium citreum TaxID=2036 RepID=UPI002026DE31|nr:hypothetical protein [Curtobacterium albidum]MCL9665127.1 hypothetical protein [Curtobacterium albidum]